MAATDLPMTPATAPSQSIPSQSGTTAGTQASTSAAPANRDLGDQKPDDFEAVLTQLLAAPSAAAAATAPATATAVAAASDTADEDLIDDIFLDPNAADAVANAGIPWELMLANAVATPREPSLPAASAKEILPLNASGVKPDAGAAAATAANTPLLARTAAEGQLANFNAVKADAATAANAANVSSALLKRASIDGQAAQVARDVQMLLGKDVADLEQPQARERGAIDGVGLATALSASALTAQQIVPATEQSHVRAHVGAAAWADELGAKLTMMTERGMQSASLRLSPEHLGPLEIRISVNSDQASVWFGAAHADTRAALEQALPRLRELFASQGLNLSDAGVFREPPREQAKNYQATNHSILGDGEQEIRVTALRPRGSVDAYA